MNLTAMRNRFWRWRRRIEIVEQDCAIRGLTRGVNQVLLGELNQEGHLAVEHIRMRDRKWLTPWEATTPVERAQPLTIRAYLHKVSRDRQAERAYYFGIYADRELVGQVSLSGVERGATQGATIGYWIISRAAGRGITPLAVAMLIDWCFEVAGLHRVEINVRPENMPSLRVVQKLGLRYEGERKSYLHIAGKWADHYSYAITETELTRMNMVARLRRRIQTGTTQ